MRMCNPAPSDLTKLAYRPLQGESIGLSFHRCTEVFNRLLKGVANRERDFLDQVRPFAMPPRRVEDKQGDEEARMLRALVEAGALTARFHYGDYERISYMIEHFIASQIFVPEATQRLSESYRAVYASPAGINWTRCNDTFRRLLECFGSCGESACERFVASVLEFAMDPYVEWNSRGYEELRLIRLLTESTGARRSTSYDDFERIAYMIERYDAACHAASGGA
jgi:hypothetical protein